QTMPRWSGEGQPCFDRYPGPTRILHPSQRIGGSGRFKLFILGPSVRFSAFLLPFLSALTVGRRTEADNGKLVLASGEKGTGRRRSRSSRRAFGRRAPAAGPVARARSARVLRCSPFRLRRRGDANIAPRDRHT